MDSNWRRFFTSLFFLIVLSGGSNGQRGCFYGPTGNTCDYDVLIPSPECCDFYRQCANNVEYEEPCPNDADGERLWFDEEFQVRG